MTPVAASAVFRAFRSSTAAFPKEAIGGYFLLQVDTFDEAVEIAKQCPGLDYGIDVEVRPVAEQCAARVRANVALAQATA